MAEGSNSVLPLDELNRIGEAQFVSLLGGIVEHSPWVASLAWRQRPFHRLADLGAAFEASIQQAPRTDQLALIRAHPELAAREAEDDELTPESAREQTSAGLHRLSGDEVKELRRLNRAYRERFGFPLIVCVSDHTKHSILEWGSARLERSREQEIDTALGEIAKIAHRRLSALVQGQW